MVWILKILRNCIVDTKVKDARSACQEIKGRGIPALETLNNAVVTGIQLMREKLEKGEYPLLDLIAPDITEDMGDIKSCRYEDIVIAITDTLMQHDACPIAMP